MSPITGSIESTVIAACALAFFMLVAGAADGAKSDSPQQLIARADSSFDARNFEHAMKLYRDAIDAASAAADPSAQLEATAQIARCYLTQSQFEGAREWLDKATAMASDKHPGGFARYLGVKGRFEWREGRNDSAVAVFSQMYEYSKSHKMPVRAIDACRMMAIVSSPQEQIIWGKRGIAEAEAANMPENLPSLWNNLAAAYGDMKNFEESYQAFVKAREYHQLYGNETTKLYADYQVGWALRMKGDFDQALTWLRPALAAAEKAGNQDVQAQACEDIGEILIAKKDPAAGLVYLRRALDLFVKEGYREHSPAKVSALETRISEVEKQ